MLHGHNLSDSEDGVLISAVLMSGVKPNLDVLIITGLHNGSISLLKVRNFTMVHPDYGQGIARLLEQFKASVSTWHVNSSKCTRFRS